MPFEKTLKSISSKTYSESDTCFLSSNIFLRQISSAFEWEAYHLSFDTPTGSASALRLIWIDGALAMTLLVAQWANVAGE